jgi:hypothetical protein
MVTISFGKDEPVNVMAVEDSWIWYNDTSL